MPKCIQSETLKLQDWYNCTSMVWRI